jgi:DNA-binding NarL/FixJ family response regulator
MIMQSSLVPAEVESRMAEIIPAFWPGLGESCPRAALTPAEQRVLHMVQLGLSNKEIASALGRAEPTIKNQVASCLRKFGVPSRARLMALLR